MRIVIALKYFALSMLMVSVGCQSPAPSTKSSAASNTGKPTAPSQPNPFAPAPPKLTLPSPSKDLKPGRFAWVGQWNADPVDDKTRDGAWEKFEKRTFKMTVFADEASSPPISLTATHSHDLYKHFQGVQQEGGSNTAETIQTGTEYKVPGSFRSWWMRAKSNDRTGDSNDERERNGAVDLETVEVLSSGRQICYRAGGVDDSGERLSLEQRFFLWQDDLAVSVSDDEGRLSNAGVIAAVNATPKDRLIIKRLPGTGPDPELIRDTDGDSLKSLDGE